MLIWDIIRDWFVQFIFGGIDSNGDVFSGIVGSQYVSEPGIGQLPGFEGYEAIYGEEFYFNIGNYQISIADWLSTTATIITLVAMVVFFYLIIRYLFRLTSGLIRGR